MTPMIGDGTLWVIPLEEVIDNIEPAKDLCKLFHFTPKKLVEGLVHEWFRFHFKSGPYQLNQVFCYNRKDLLEHVKSAYLIPEDVLMYRFVPTDVSSFQHVLEDAETIIDATGHAVFNALTNYVDQLGVPTDALTRVDIVGWAYKSLVVRFL